MLPEAAARNDGIDVADVRKAEEVFVGVDELSGQCAVVPFVRCAQGELMAKLAGRPVPLGASRLWMWCDSSMRAA